MLNWLWKRLGYHVCEKFSPWKKKKKREYVQVTLRAGVVVSEVPVVELFQERKCLECNRAYCLPWSTR